MLCFRSAYQRPNFISPHLCGRAILKCFLTHSCITKLIRPPYVSGPRLKSARAAGVLNCCNVKYFVYQNLNLRKLRNSRKWAHCSEYFICFIRQIFLLSLYIITSYLLIALVIFPRDIFCYVFCVTHRFYLFVSGRNFC